MALAEEALALLAAFTDQDIEEISFRATLLFTYARDAGYTRLATASLALLEEVGGFARHRQEEGAMLSSLEQVIAATASIVVPVVNA